MGLSFSHGRARSSYGGFAIFRRTLMASASPRLTGHEVTDVEVEILRGDPIWPLIDHSDCDGELSPEECRTIAPRIRELVSKWPPGFYLQYALLLADGMEEAARLNEVFEFT